MGRRLGSVSMALALCACGGTASSTTTAHLPTERAADPAARRAPLATEAPMPSGRPFAPTPITALADELTDLALAALAGEPVAPPSVPLAGPLASPPPLAWRTDSRPEDAQVLGIAFEVTLVMKRGEPDPDDDGPDRFGAIRATLALSRAGLRVVGLRPRMLSRSYRAGRLPLAMMPMREVCVDLLASLRAEDITAYRMTDEERALLDNETVWMQMVEDRVPQGRVRQISQMLAALPEEPIAYVLDDIAVLVRDRDASLYSLAFDFDQVGDSFALGTEPLIEIRRVWPLTDLRSDR